MNAVTRLDKTLREFALTRDREFRERLARDLMRAFTVELIARWQKDRRLLKPVSPEEIDFLANELIK